MNYKVDRAFRGLSAVEFTREFLDLFDTRELTEFKFRRPASSRATGIWGNCKPPFCPNMNHRTFRISCSQFGGDENFPKTFVGRGRLAGTIRPEYVAESVNELLAWVAGHEIFHFLAQPTRVIWGHPNATGQIGGRVDSERGADLMGYEFLYAIREGRDPIEVADAISADAEGLVAPSRFPYRRGA